MRLFTFLPLPCARFPPPYATSEGPCISFAGSRDLKFLTFLLSVRLCPSPFSLSTNHARDKTTRQHYTIILHDNTTRQHCSSSHHPLSFRALSSCLLSSIRPSSLRTSQGLSALQPATRQQPSDAAEGWDSRRCGWADTARGTAAHEPDMHVTESGLLFAIKARVGGIPLVMRGFFFLLVFLLPSLCLPGLRTTFNMHPEALFNVIYQPLLFTFVLASTIAFPDQAP